MKNNYEDSSRASWQSKHKWISYVLVFCMILSTFVTMGPLTAYGGDGDGVEDETIKTDLDLGIPHKEIGGGYFVLSNLKIDSDINDIKTAVITVDSGNITLPKNDYRVYSDINNRTMTILFGEEGVTYDVATQFLRQVKFTPASGSVPHVKIAIDNQYSSTLPENATIRELNEHYYMYVPKNITWTEALKESHKWFYMGMRGYLATISSPSEDKILRDISSAGAWASGVDKYINLTNIESTGYPVDGEAYSRPEGVDYVSQIVHIDNTWPSVDLGRRGDFIWADGPEAHTDIENKNFKDDSWGWSAIQPQYMSNDSKNGTNEWYLQVNYTDATQKYPGWNDLPNDGSNLVSGYFVEFGGYDNAPNGNQEQGQNKNGKALAEDEVYLVSAEAVVGEVYCKTVADAISAAKTDTTKTVTILESTVTPIDGNGVDVADMTINNLEKGVFTGLSDTIIKMESNRDIVLTAGSMKVKKNTGSVGIIMVADKTVKGEAFTVDATARTVTVARGKSVTIDGVTFDIPEKDSDEQSDDVTISLENLLLATNVPNGTTAKIPANNPDLFVTLGSTAGTQKVANTGNSEMVVTKVESENVIGKVILTTDGQVTIGENQLSRSYDSASTNTTLEIKKDGQVDLTVGAVKLDNQEAICIDGVEVTNPADGTANLPITVEAGAKDSDIIGYVTLPKDGESVAFCGKVYTNEDTEATVNTKIAIFKDGTSVNAQLEAGKVKLETGENIFLGGVAVTNTNDNEPVKPIIVSAEGNNKNVVIKDGGSVKIGDYEFTNIDTDAETSDMIISIDEELKVPFLSKGNVSIEKGANVYTSVEGTPVLVENKGNSNVEIVAENGNSSIKIPAGGEAIVNGIVYANNGKGDLVLPLNDNSAFKFIKDHMAGKAGKIEALSSENYKKFLDGTTDSILSKYDDLSDSSKTNLDNLLALANVPGFDKFEKYITGANDAVTTANKFVTDYLTGTDGNVYKEVTADNYKQILKGEKEWGNLIAKAHVNDVVADNFKEPVDPNKPDSELKAIENYPKLLVAAKIEASKHGGGSVDSFYKDRTNAVTVLDKYVDLSKYDADGQKAIKDILAQAKKDINGAKDKAEIDKAKAKAMALIDDVLTKTEKERIAAIGELKLVARSKLTKLNGVKAVRVHWFAKDGRDISKIFDGYTVERSTKRYSGYEKFFSTENEHYYNNKALKKGARYYYRVKGYAEINGTTYTSEWSYKAWRYVK